MNQARFFLVSFFTSSYATSRKQRLADNNKQGAVMR